MRGYRIVFYQFVTTWYTSDIYLLQTALFGFALEVRNGCGRSDARGLLILVPSATLLKMLLTSTYNLGQNK